MSDLISRADVIEHFQKMSEDDYYDFSWQMCLVGVVNELKALPSAEAVSLEEHVKELNDLAVEWKAKFAKAEKITDEIYAETMAKVARECEECKERLRNIHPSADAEWIPCSERLPEKTGWYLVTVVGFETITDMLIFYREVSAWSDITDKQKVIAWMPLPKPYREDGEE